jgi:hypothetical protein
VKVAQLRVTGYINQMIKSLLLAAGEYPTVPVPVLGTSVTPAIYPGFPAVILGSTTEVPSAFIKKLD